MGVSELVILIAQALHYHGKAKLSGLSHDEIGDENEGDPLRASDPTELPRCFGAGLGLLSMQLDLLDTLQLNLTAQTAAADATLDSDGGNVSAPLAPTSSVAVLEQQMAAKNIRERQEKLRAQSEALNEQVLAMWSAIISANTSAWAELSSYCTLGVAEEEVLKRECWLFGALKQALAEVAGGNLRCELLPSDCSSSLLDAAIAQSGVGSYRLSADGSAIQATGAPNNRVPHVIKVCVSLALRNVEEEIIMT